MRYINLHLLTYLLTYLLYADDTQIYGSTRYSAVNDLERRLLACIDDVYSWMQSNRLQLNTNKTELLWCTTTRRQHLLPRSALRIGADAVTPSTTVRDLGIFIDADLSMRSHVQRTVAGCFAVLLQLRSISSIVCVSDSGRRPRAVQADL